MSKDIYSEHQHTDSGVDSTELYHSDMQTASAQNKLSEPTVLKYTLPFSKKQAKKSRSTTFFKLGRHKIPQISFNSPLRRQGASNAE